MASTSSVSTRSFRDDRTRFPPAYLSCASLARELDCSETTVLELVRKGVLPKPLRLSNGTVRWCWAEIEAALTSLNAGTENFVTDPFLQGVTNVATKA